LALLKLTTSSTWLVPAPEGRFLALEDAINVTRLAGRKRDDQIAMNSR
jgi:hypothetical protein